MIEDLQIDDGLDSIDTSKGIALIDCDTLVYTTCLECEIAEEQLPKTFHTDDEWKEIIEHPGYHEESHTIYTFDEDLLRMRAVEKVKEILYATNTKSAELYFSSGENFRHKVTDMYKANRAKMRYPAGLGWLKQEMTNLYEGEVCKGYEADDIVVYLKRKYPKKYVLVAIDKDVLNAVPGKHFDYYYRRMKWKETNIETATAWPYLQCLMGDTADNIEGIKGVGIKTAEKALADCLLPCDYWHAVAELYIEKGKTIKHAIETMRLVWMHSLYKDSNGKLQIRLWEPPCHIIKKDSDEK